jgi:hypothetical protein
MIRHTMGLAAVLVGGVACSSSSGSPLSFAESVGTATSPLSLALAPSPGGGPPVPPSRAPVLPPQLEITEATSASLRGFSQKGTYRVDFEVSRGGKGEAIARLYGPQQRLVFEATVTPDGAGYVRIGALVVPANGDVSDAVKQAFVRAVRKQVHGWIGFIPMELGCRADSLSASGDLLRALVLPYELLRRFDPRAFAPDKVATAVSCPKAYSAAPRVAPQPPVLASSAASAGPAVSAAFDTGGCDSPASSVTKSNNGTCCDDHDIGYHVNGCTAASWLWTALGIAGICTEINEKVVACIAGNLGHGPSVCVANGTCGWQWCGGKAPDLNAGHYCPPDDAACNCKGPCMDDGSACSATNSNCGDVDSANCPGKRVSCGACDGASFCNLVSGFFTWQCQPSPSACVDDGVACSGKECGTFPSNNCTHPVPYPNAPPAPEFMTCGVCDPQFSCVDGQCGKPAVGTCLDDGQACQVALANNPSFCGWVQSHNCTSTVPCNNCSDPTAECENGVCVVPPCTDDGQACDGAVCGDVQSRNCPNLIVSCACSGSNVCGSDGTCHPPPCTPCANQQCGTDLSCNSGQSCGDCAANEDCTSDGVCVVKEYCGDGTCNNGEDCASCPADCGCGSGDTCSGGACVPQSFCGDGVCDPDEDCSTCEVDCGPCAPPDPGGCDWWEQDYCP